MSDDNLHQNKRSKLHPRPEWTEIECQEKGENDQHTQMIKRLRIDKQEEEEEDRGKYLLVEYSKKDFKVAGQYYGQNIESLSNFEILPQPFEYHPDL